MTQKMTQKNDTHHDSGTLASWDSFRTAFIDTPQPACVDTDWVKALRALMEDDVQLVTKLHLVVGEHTHFFYHAGGVVGLALPDTKLTHTLVNTLTAPYKACVYFGYQESCVERFGFRDFVRFIVNNPSVRWQGNVLTPFGTTVGPAMQKAFVL